MCNQSEAGRAGTGTGAKQQGTVPLGPGLENTAIMNKEYRPDPACFLWQKQKDTLKENGSLI